MEKIQECAHLYWRTVSSSISGSKPRKSPNFSVYLTDRPTKEVVRDFVLNDADLEKEQYTITDAEGQLLGRIYLNGIQPQSWIPWRSAASISAIPLLRGKGYGRQAPSGFSTEPSKEDTPFTGSIWTTTRATNPPAASTSPWGFSMRAVPAAPARRWDNITTCMSWQS